MRILPVVAATMMIAGLLATGPAPAHAVDAFPDFWGQAPAQQMPPSTTR